jgi:hypothetical protein
MRIDLTPEEQQWASDLAAHRTRDGIPYDLRATVHAVLAEAHAASRPGSHDPDEADLFGLRGSLEEDPGVPAV